ncbi:MAG: hypothetical protein KF870_06520 [Leadbetterella sp.]|nr:hypothetical protein [Leadbetterella sp.]
MNKDKPKPEISAQGREKFSGLEPQKALPATGEAEIVLCRRSSIIIQISKFTA